MSSYLKLGFNTHLNKTATLSIHNPKLNADKDLIKDVMDNIISLNIIDFTAGVPIARKSAAIVTKTESKINLA